MQDNSSGISGSGIVQGVRMGVGLIPGFGQAADLALAPIQGDTEKREQLDKLSKSFGIRDITQERHSGGVQKHVGKLSHNWLRLTAAAASGLGGGALGALIGTFLIPIPMVGTFMGFIIGSVFFLGGAIGGGMLGDLAYNKMTAVPNEDSILLVQELRAAQKSGQPVLPEMVFAALAGNMRGTAGKRLEKELERLTGTKDFYVASQQGRMEALHTLMVNNDSTIRADTGMMVDMKNPLKTVSEQLADWINLGGLDARHLLVKKTELPIQSLEQANRLPMQVGAGGMGLTAPSLPLAANIPNLPNMPRGVTF